MINAFGSTVTHRHIDAANHGLSFPQNADGDCKER